MKILDLDELSNVTGAAGRADVRKALKYFKSHDAYRDQFKLGGAVGVLEHATKAGFAAFDKPRGWLGGISMNRRLDAISAF